MIHAVARADDENIEWVHAANRLLPPELRVVICSKEEFLEQAADAKWMVDLSELGHIPVRALMLECGVIINRVRIGSMWRDGVNCVGVSGGTSLAAVLLSETNPERLAAGARSTWGQGR